MRYLNDPDGTRLPVKLDTTTNGEFAPIPLEPVHHSRGAWRTRRRARMRGVWAWTGAPSSSPRAAWRLPSLA